jgi:oligopeptidase B
VARRRGFPVPGRAVTPPRAPARPVRRALHGEVLVDEYAWLRDRDDPAVRRHLEAENAWAAAHLAPLAPLEARLYDEMLGRIRQTDLSVPYRDGAWWYYHRTEEGRQYPVYCRRRDAAGSPEEVLLDLNELAAGRSFMALGAFEVSPGGRFLAYSTDPTGGLDYTLAIKDLATGERVGPLVPGAGSVAWALDDTTFFCTIEDAAKRDYRVYRRRRDSDRAELVYEEPDERFRVHVAATRSRAWLVLTAGSHTTTEQRLLPAGAPDAPWRLVAARVPEREYELDHLDDRFLIRVNDTGPNFRVVAAPVAAPGPDRWEEMLPHRDDVIVEGVDCFAGHWVAWERRDGLPAVRVTDAATWAAHDLEFPEAVYDVRPGANAEFHTTRLRYVYDSFVTPTSVYDVDMATGTRELLKRKDVLGGYDPAAYTTERLHAEAADGTRIPVSLVRRRDADPAVPGPLHLTGYGAYGIPYPVTFNSNRVSLLDRGVAVAIAHVRGGGELGRRWHDQGRLAHKTNTFTDFLAVIDHLVDAGRTRQDRLTIEGGSAGGLLVGAVLNRRPDCCRAAVLQVPFVDVINTMLDPSLPLTVGEYDEWGDPSDPVQYRWIRAYCPYTNLAARPYPALLVRTALHDSQVMFWEPAKYVARLRALRPSGPPVLLLANLGAGHGGASGRYDRLREVAADYAFLLWQHGLADVPPPPSPEDA